MLITIGVFSCPRKKSPPPVSDFVVFVLPSFWRLSTLSTFSDSRAVSMISRLSFRVLSLGLREASLSPGFSCTRSVPHCARWYQFCICLRSVASVVALSGFRVDPYVYRRPVYSLRENGVPFEVLRLPPHDLKERTLASFLCFPSLSPPKVVASSFTPLAPPLFSL